MEPRELAQAWALRNQADALNQRVEQQLAEDEAEYSAQWIGYDSETGEHLIQRPGGSPIPVGTSFTSGGFAPNQSVDAAYSPGLVAVSAMPRTPRETVQPIALTRTLTVLILVTEESQTIAGSLEPPSGVGKYYLKRNNQFFQIANLLSQFDKSLIAYDASTLYYTSDFVAQNFAILNNGTAIVQISETAVHSLAVDSFATSEFDFAMHTVIVRNQQAQVYSSTPQIITTDSSPIAIDYPSELAPYTNFLIPTVVLGGFPDYALPPAFVGKLNFDIADITNQFVWQNRAHFVVGTANGQKITPDPAWYKLLNAATWQMSTSLTNLFPEQQRITITTTDLGQASLTLTTDIYVSQFAETPAGTIADVIDPNSTFNETAPRYFWVDFSGQRRQFGATFFRGFLT